MTSEILSIVQCFADIVEQVFLGLDTVKFEGISILDMFLAILFFRVLLWFILKILGAQEKKEKED
jgi:hypothetical protein